MTYQEIVKQARQLPLNERWLGVNELLHSLQGEAAAEQGLEFAEAQRQRLASIPPASAMLGILKSDRPIPTDEEIKEDYINYLTRKYS